MSIKVEEFRREVDETYVGFSPNTQSVKPVHLANGFFRTLAGEIMDTKRLVRFAIPQNQKGVVPKGHDLDSVRVMLDESSSIDPSISNQDLARLRTMVRRVLSADKALYTEGMDSYSAVGEAFLSKDRIGQDAGEFVADWIVSTCPELATCLLGSLKDRSDPITLLCSPVAQIAGSPYTHEDGLKLASQFHGFPEPARELWEGMRLASASLAAHLTNHPSKLVRGRLAVLFIGFTVVRYLASLESIYVPGSLPPTPFLLCFNSEDRSVPETSKLSYQHVGQSISRFYAWAFGQITCKYYSLEDAIQLPSPTYKKHEEQAGEIWKSGVVAASDSDEGFTLLGQALYDILAMEAEASPVTYLRSLSVRLGLAWPANNAHPFKQFRTGPDLIEVLVMGVVAPEESGLSLDELQQRMWDRYRIVIGGHPEDQERLRASGIYRADTDALRLNRAGFVTMLANLGMALQMADGVVEVGFGGNV